MAKRTHEEFIKKFEENQPTLFRKIEILSRYDNHNSKLLVRTKYGNCLVPSLTLLKGKTPTIQTAVNKTEYFKNQMLEINPNYLSIFEIIGEYTHCHSSIEVKTPYGICKCDPYSLLRCHIPSIKTAINKTEYFINKSKSIHGDLYDYSLVEYRGDDKKVMIISPCGKIFEQSPTHHYMGQGCPILGREKVRKSARENPSGWEHSKWKTAGLASKNFESFKVYIIECWDNNERFYKIGKTFTTVKRRFSGKDLMPYSYKIVKIIEGDAEFICKLENKLKTQNKNYTYLPSKKFKGMYECFSKINLNISRQLLPLN